MRVESVATISIQKELSPVPSATAEVTLVEVAGERWYRKRWKGSGTMAGELLGYLLARAFEIPTPDFAIVADEPTALLSKQVEACPAGAADSAQLGQVLMLDALIVNDDRHLGNLGLRADGRLVAFDFDKAHLGIPHFAAGYDNLKLPDIPSQTLEGVDRPELKVGVQQVASLAAKLDDTLMERLAESALRGSNALQEDLEMLVPTLKSRCRNALELARVLEAKLDGGVDARTKGE